MKENMIDNNQIITKLFIRILKENNLYKEYINNYNYRFDYYQLNFYHYILQYNIQHILKSNKYSYNHNDWQNLKQLLDNIKIIEYISYFYQTNIINEKYIKLLLTETKFKKLKIKLLYNNLKLFEKCDNLMLKLSHIQPLEWILYFLLLFLFSPIFVLLSMLILKN